MQVILIIRYEIKIFCHKVSSKNKKNTWPMNISMHFYISFIKIYDFIFPIISPIFLPFSKPSIKAGVFEMSPIKIPPAKFPDLK